MNAAPFPKRAAAGKKNGELLFLADKFDFEVFLTVDRGLEYEQNLKGRKISVILVSANSSRLADLLPLVPALLSALRSIRVGELIRVLE
jgi:hypothetical protein